MKFMIYIKNKYKRINKMKDKMIENYIDEYI